MIQILCSSVITLEEALVERLLEEYVEAIVTIAVCYRKHFTGSLSNTSYGYERMMLFAVFLQLHNTL